MLIATGNPARLSRARRALDYRAAVGDTVPDAQIKAAAAFLTVEVSHIGLDLAIQSQNLGVAAVLAGQRNAEYLSRWSSSFQRLRGGVS